MEATVYGTYGTNVSVNADSAVRFEEKEAVFSRASGGAAILVLQNETQEKQREKEHF